MSLRWAANFKGSGKARVGVALWAVDGLRWYCPAVEGCPGSESRLNDLILWDPAVLPCAVFGRSNANIETSGTDFCFINAREPVAGRLATEVDVLRVRAWDITGRRRTGLPLTMVVVAWSCG